MIYIKKIIAAVLLFALTSICCSYVKQKLNKPRKNIPKDYTVLKPAQKWFKLSQFTVLLYSSNFQQGDAIYVECIDCSNEIDEIGCKFLNHNIPLVKRSWGFRGLVPIDPDIKPGKNEMTIIYKANDITGSTNIKLNINNAKFKTVVKSMHLGKYSDKKYLKKEENVNHIEESENLRKEAFSHYSPDFLSSIVSHPRDTHFVTSQFWFKRVYREYYEKDNKRKLKKSIKIHRGIDLRGDPGAPVYSMESGNVVLAADLFFEGKTIIIDHGMRIFSYYMHLNEMFVSKGEMVVSGQRIGAVGSSGRVTGPHLHVSFIIDKVQVDPLSMLCLPISR